MVEFEGREREIEGKVLIELQTQVDAVKVELRQDVDHLRQRLEKSDSQLSQLEDELSSLKDTYQSQVKDLKTDVEARLRDGCQDVVMAKVRDEVGGVEAVFEQKIAQLLSRSNQNEQRIKEVEAGEWGHKIQALAERLDNLDSESQCQVDLVTSSLRKMDEEKQKSEAKLRETMEERARDAWDQVERRTTALEHRVDKLETELKAEHSSLLQQFNDSSKELATLINDGLNQAGQANRDRVDGLGIRVKHLEDDLALKLDTHCQTTFSELRDLKAKTGDIMEKMLIGSKSCVCVCVKYHHSLSGCTISLPFFPFPSSLWPISMENNKSKWSRPSSLRKPCI